VFASGLFVRPQDWNSKQQRFAKTCSNWEINNAKLELIKSKAISAHFEAQVIKEYYSVSDVLRLFRGEKDLNDIGVLEFYRSYLKRLRALVDVEIKEITWNKFDYIYNDLSTFIKKKYKVHDVVITALDMSFMHDLEYHYKVKKGLKQITINKKLQRFRKVIKEAIVERHLSEDPFLSYKAKRVSKHVVFLSTEELKMLEGFKFSQPRLNVVKDLFIFSCYSGLAYNELSKLEKKDIIKGFDGNLWIQMTREKTDKPLSIPILPKAETIINRYNLGGRKALPKISNQKYNSYLKEIAAIVGIEKRMTTHMARRTFASTVLLYNDVPMEVVSELLGHSSLKVTQESYGKVVQRKISMEMKRLRDNI
jgi:site-specific recombinase XerD